MISIHKAISSQADDLALNDHIGVLRVDKDSRRNFCMSTKLVFFGWQRDSSGFVEDPIEQVHRNGEDSFVHQDAGNKSKVL